MNIELAIEKINALLKVDGIDPQNKERVLKSILETCLPTRLTKVYMEYIYIENNDEENNNDRI